MPYVISCDVYKVNKQNIKIKNRSVHSRKVNLVTNLNATISKGYASFSCKGNQRELDVQREPDTIYPQDTSFFNRH